MAEAAQTSVCPFSKLATLPIYTINRICEVAFARPSEKTDPWWRRTSSPITVRATIQRGRLGEGLLVAIVERDVIGGRVVGLKANAAAHHKGDRLRFGFSNNLRQRRSRFVVVHHLVSEFTRVR